MVIISYFLYILIGLFSKLKDFAGSSPLSKYTEVRSNATLVMYELVTFPHLDDTPPNINNVESTQQEVQLDIVLRQNASDDDLTVKLFVECEDLSQKESGG